MAFEDRSSPDAACSPSGTNKGAPDSPESSRTTPYTCPIITKSETTASNPTQTNNFETKSPFFRITQYALSKPEPSPNPEPLTLQFSREQPNQESSTLKYSIHNILQPDFGKSALQKTRCAAFKPYERVPQVVKSPPPTPEPATTVSASDDTTKSEDSKVPTLWPAWVYCTRYSDRPSSGPRSRRIKKPTKSPGAEEKRPRTAFSGAQLARLKHEFAENRYLTERRRQQLSAELGLNEAQIKIWFQNKRAKIKKASGQKNPLALQLMAQGLYNHSTVPCDEDELAMTVVPQ